MCSCLGILMVIAWVFFASTGVLVARHYKFLLGERKFFDVHAWFAIHRPFMIAAPVISSIALLVILAQLNWTWVSTTLALNFSHSIFGICAIILSFIQVWLCGFFLQRGKYSGFILSKVLIGFLRVDKDHPKRFIFNHVHRATGMMTLLLASRFRFFQK